MVCVVPCSLEFSIGPVILYVVFWVINLGTMSWRLQQDKPDLYYSSASNREENAFQPSINRHDFRMSDNPETEVQLVFGEASLEHKANDDLIPFEFKDDEGPCASVFGDPTSTVREEASEVNAGHSGPFVDNASPPMLDYLRTGFDMGFHNRNKLIAGTSSNGDESEIASVFGQGSLNANQTLDTEPIDMHKQA